MDEFAHVDEEGASMVDVTDKPTVRRTAVATGAIELRPSTLEAIEDETTEKGDVLTTSRIAAIQAVKRTSEDIPMCHPIPITGIDVSFDARTADLRARVDVTSTAKTGVEMEALNGVTRALLTAWDMVKSAEKDDDGQYPDTRLHDVRVESKRKRPIGETFDG